MHVVVPHASDTSEACRHVLQDLELPNLKRLLRRWRETTRDDGAETAFSPPHERVLAAAWGWRGGDGALPFAAQQAAKDGIDIGTHAWGLLTPCHWILGRDHVVMAASDDVALDEDGSRALFEAVSDLFASEGFRVAWGAPTRWYVARDDLDGFATASLDRVVHRDVEAWIGHDDVAHVAARRALRRLQSEAQLVFHAHAVNEAREAAGKLPVNSVWLSGCGRAQPVPDAAVNAVMTDDALSRPMQNGDWAAWADAWRAVDAGTVRRVFDAGESGTPTRLTLCGERAAATFAPADGGWWQRLVGSERRGQPHDVMQGL